MARESNADILKRYRSRLDTAVKWRKEEGLDDLWLRMREMYRIRHIPASKTEDRITVAVAFATINAIHPSVTVNNPKITVAARDPEDNDRAVIVETVINYWWRYKDIKDEFRLAVKDSLIFGHGWLKTTWKFEEGEVDLTEDEYNEKIDEAFSQVDTFASENPEAEGDLPAYEDIIKGVSKTKTVTVHDQAVVRRISPFDVFVNPEATSIRDVKWICHRTYRSLEDCKEDKRYDSRIRSNLSGTSSIDKKFGSDNRNQKTDCKRCCIYEFYDIEDGVLCIFADEGDGFLVKPKQIPYTFGHPFVFIPNFEVPDYFYPLGDLEAIESLQHELDKTRSQMMNHRRRFHRKYLANPDAFDAQGRQALASDNDGEVVLVKNGVPFSEAIAPVPLTPIPADAYNYSQIIEEDIRQVTGVSEYQRGTSPDIRRTATEAALIQDAANARAADKLSRVETAVSEVATRLVALAQKYMTGEQVARIVGANGEPFWVPFDTEDISGEYDFEVEAGSTQPSNEGYRRQQAIAMLQALGPLIGPVIDPAQIARHVLQMGFGIKNPEKFIVSAPPGPPPPGAPPGPGVEPQAPPGASGGIPPEIISQLQAQTGLPAGTS